MNKIGFTFILSCVLSFVCCIQKAADNRDASKDAPEYEILPAENIDLSEFRKDSDGYIILFDGTSMKGWRKYGKNFLPPKWKIVDTCLTTRQYNNEPGEDIIFNHTFKNFDLELEWKVPKGGNSGIFYLAREVIKKELTTNELKLQPIFISAPEYQILDPEHPDTNAGKQGNRKSGSLYDMIPAAPDTEKPHGKWNKAKITVYNGNVTHWLNGIKVVEYSFLSQQWIELLQAGKFGEVRWPLAFELMKNCGGDNHEGYIGLQDIGDSVSFRNIRIKILD